MATGAPVTVAATKTFFGWVSMLNSIHTFGGYPVEPIDLHASIRHLEAAYDAHTLTDKSFHTYSLGKQRNLDGIEMARISRWDRRQHARSRTEHHEHHQRKLAASL